MHSTAARNGALHPFTRHSWQLHPLLRLYILVSAVIDAIVASQVHHIYTVPGYAAVRDMLHLVPWSLTISVACSALFVLYARRFGWSVTRSVIAADCFASALPLIMVRCLRIYAIDRRMHTFGVVLAVFVLLKGVALVFIALQNALELNKNAVRAYVCVASLLVYLAITPWAARSAWPDADEPHYLLLTHSLVFDHDFDLANNYQRQDYKAYYPPDIPPEQHHTLRYAGGHEYAIHDVGVSILLVPGYAIAGRLGAMVEINLFAALLVLALFELGVALSGTYIGALRSWPLFAFASPLITYSSQIYPEVPGGALAAMAMLFFIRYTRTARLLDLVLVGTFFAPLPWLSVRYWIILGPAMIVVGLYVLNSRTWRHRLGGLSCLVAPLLGTLIAFAIFDLRFYHTPLPNAGYVLFVPTMNQAMFEPGRTVIGLCGLLFDRAYGLLAISPVYVIAIAGIAIAFAKRRWAAAVLGVPIASYLLFAAPNRWWYGGWAPPSRYIFVAVALLIPFAAPALADRVSRVLVFLVAAWSYWFAFGFTAFPLTRYTLWTRTTGALSDLVATHVGFHFDAVFPSFIRAGAIDRTLTIAWVAAAGVAIWWLTITSRRHASEKTRSPM